MLCLDKSPSSSSDSAPSSVQIHKATSCNPIPQSSDHPAPPTPTSEIPRSATASAQDMMSRQKDKQPEQPVRSPGSTDLGQGGRGGGKSLGSLGKSTSSLAISGSQQHLAGSKEPTPSIASDISNPYATQELQLRLQQLQKSVINKSARHHF